MSSVALGLMIDIFLLFSLGMTIYYAMRLSGHLNNFKTYKEDLQTLIVQLSSHIDEAQTAMTNLRATGEETSEELIDLIKESKGLSEELQMINQVGDNIANRLELLSEGTSQERKLKSSAESAQAFPDKPSAPPRDIAAGPAGEADDLPGFFIQDREFEDEGAMDDDVEIPADLESEAEKELFKALQKRRSA